MISLKLDDILSPMSRIQVVAMTIQRERSFLLGRRSLAKAVAPGYWCPISGKIDAGESEEQALVREAHEEIAVQIRPTRKLARIDCDLRQCTLHWWLVDLIKGDPVINNEENSEIAWFTFAEIARLKPVFPEDVAIYRSLTEDQH
ncbi:MAG: NUDIX domain-containing protein [Bdellovibrionales bacterium]|nr:NUDIX domain-containing protein [Bdellovibrionales bacterium]